MLTEQLPGLLASIKFRGNMRWRGDTAFSRPLRSLLALHGPAVLPFAFAGLRAGRATHGLRSATASDIEVGATETVACTPVPPLPALPVRCSSQMPFAAYGKRQSLPGPLADTLHPC